MNEIKIHKITGTYADTLQAIGTASLLEEISGAQTTVQDMGNYFKVNSSTYLAPDQWKALNPGFYYVWEEHKEKEKPFGDLVLDYNKEKKITESNKKLRSKTKKDLINKAMEEQGLTQIENVHPEYRHSAILASMRKGWRSDKDIYNWIVKNPDKTVEWLKSELDNNHTFKLPIKVSNSQFFNPVSGKGVHASKTTAKSPGAISGELVEPFAEWMKYRGTYQAMLSYRNGDDFKMFVMEPSNIGPNALFMLRKELMKLNLWGGIRLDIDTSLCLAEQLILHSDVLGKSKQQVGIRQKKPAEVISGLRQAFFKSMGTAAALMNDAFFPLPSWFQIDDINDANNYLNIIEEHIGHLDNGKRKQGCLNSLNENHSNDITILQQYRKWLTTNNYNDLLDFLVLFAVHIMQKRGNKEWVKEFSTKNLTILFERSYGMKDIVGNEGFLSVARGIRNCTIYAISLGKREIQFGLAQEWKQKIKGGNERFIPVLCEFVQAQNWEVEHKLKGKGHSIKKEDLDSVIELIGKYGSELVGMMLLAYGFARAPKTESDIEL